MAWFWPSTFDFEELEIVYLDVKGKRSVWLGFGVGGLDLGQETLGL